MAKHCRRRKQELGVEHRPATSRRACTLQGLWSFLLPQRVESDAQAAVEVAVQV